jgi:1-acyl-sn-glycerol-3-phosphate acyltransferase/MFS family permease
MNRKNLSSSSFILHPSSFEEEARVLHARIRLASLWLSQVARVLADWCLRLVAFLEWGRTGPAERGMAWHVATAVFIAPFVLLAPLNGCLCNALPRRWVLVASSAWTLLIVAVFSGLHGGWMFCLALVALGAAIYSPGRYAMLPAIATDTHIPLPRVNGWIEMGGATAIVGGIALGWGLTGADWVSSKAPVPGAIIAVLLGLNVLALLTALPAVFPSDVPRPERPGRAVADFFRDLRRIAREREAIVALLGLASFQAVVTAGSGAIVADRLTPEALEQGGLLTALVLVAVGAALGCLTAGLQGHPRRVLGFVAPGATGLLAALGWAMIALGSGASLPQVPCLLLGFTGGLINVPLRATYQAAVPADARGNAMAVMNTAIYLLMIVLAVVVLGLVGVGLLPSPAAQLAFLTVLAAIGAAGAWYWLLAQAIELATEIVLSPVYRVRACGPGLDLVPRTGPLLVVANHSAYMDPLWLSKVVPRHMTPMMTSLFFDRPIIHWLMVHAVGAIRVPDAGFRREAPELGQAVEVLRRGGCVLIFPEGHLRRREDQLLRRFGQGVWHILRDVPRTPVMPCWIEGGWGSYTSYYNGLPMQNKKRDWNRLVRIALDRPQVLPPDVLADHHATRLYLMRACLECRRYLGLDVPTGKEVRPDGGGGVDWGGGENVPPSGP